jgi:hypothetical protein
MELCSKELFRHSNLWSRVRHLDVPDDYSRRTERNWLDSKAPIELMTNVRRVDLDRLGPDAKNMVDRIHWSNVRFLSMNGSGDLVAPIISKLDLKMVESLIFSDAKEESFIPSRPMPALRVLRLSNSLPARDVLEAVLSYCPSINLLSIPNSPLGDSPQGVELLTRLLDQQQFHILYTGEVSNLEFLRGLSPQQSAKFATESAPPMCITSEHDPSAAARAKVFYEHALSADAIACGATAGLFGWAEHHRENRKPYHVAWAISALKDHDVVALMKEQLQGDFLPVHYPDLLQHLISIFLLANEESQKSVVLDLIKYLLAVSKRPLNHLVHCLSFNLDSMNAFLPPVITGEVPLDINLGEVLSYAIHFRWLPGYRGLHWSLQYDPQEITPEVGMHLTEHAAYFQRLHLLECLIDRAETDELLRKSIYQRINVRETLKWIDNIKRHYITKEERSAYKSIIELMLERSETEGVPITEKDVFWIGMVAPFFGKINMCAW